MLAFSSPSRLRGWILLRTTRIYFGLEAVHLSLETLSHNLLRHTFLGLLAKIKCSICSYQFNI